MKIVSIIFLFIFCSLSAQKVLPFDTLKLQETEYFFADDYGNIYLFKNKDFGFTKYDSLGKQLGKMMLTVPYKVQNVQNPLNIVLFSENAQEMKFVDHNLNDIQKLELRKFGFIKMAYAEDLQQIWLLDESQKRLIQYNFRQDIIINSYPFFFDFQKIKDMMVYENLLYVLAEKQFSIYNFSGEKKWETTIENGRKLRRENDDVFVIQKNGISKFNGKELEKSFQSEVAEIVDKNASSFFELKGNKLYLYPINMNDKR